MGISYKGISTGKLRRYFSFKNFADIFRIPIGIFQAIFILKSFKTQVVFSKGGFVSFPVMVGAYITKTPSILHESDVSPGLANKLSANMAKIICLSHKGSENFFTQKTKKVITGNPVRKFILHGDPQKAYKKTSFSKHIPTILVMGGSQGAKRINEVISLAVNELVKHYQIIHICGKGKTTQAKSLPFEYKNRYITFEYVDKLLPDFYSISDLVITRAGANTIAETEALQIPALLLPLSKNASRGDQLINSYNHLKNHSKSKMLEDENLDYQKLVELINKMLPYETFKKQIKSIKGEHEATNKIISVLEDFF